MDLSAARADLAAVGRTAGFNAWDYQPDDPQNYPAMVAGGVRRMMRLNKQVAEIDLVVTLYAATASSQDATRVLDRALSVGTGYSFIDALDAVTLASQPAWRSIRFTSAGPYARYAMPAGLVALGVEMILTLTG